MVFSFTAKNSGYYRVFVDGVKLSQHITEREALENAVNALTTLNDVYIDHDYKVEVMGIGENVGESVGQDVGAQGAPVVPVDVFVSVDIVTVTFEAA